MTEIVKRISSGSHWEDVVGYCRAIRINNTIEVAGTTAVEGDTIVGEGNVYEQAVFIFEKIKQALKDLNAGLNDVVRTRMFVINIDDWELVAKAHGEFFKNIKPVATMVEVKRLINPGLLIEIEATAIVHT